MSRAPDPWRDLEVEDVAKSQTLERVQGRPLSQSIPAAHVALHPGMSGRGVEEVEFSASRGLQRRSVPARILTRFTVGT